ncbi:membrane protein [Gordonia phage Avazak]|uniref:Membrane protein n=1 Tax=Gordonia phage Avazak TaxID=2656529 RepID=A0A649V6Y6_9CAUD|nr:membrane protein [Gordonia phage Avazak]QGJ88070.1 membrane protein [Gordonia phage Avazak]
MIDKVKKHVQDNKKYYLVGGVMIAGSAALAGAYILGTKAAPKEVMNHISPRQTLNWKPTQTLEVYVEALGDPGNIIQDTTTGTIYASQNQAAQALGVSRTHISDHLKGAAESVKGHQLVKLGKAHVSDLAE